MGGMETFITKIIEIQEIHNRMLRMHSLIWMQMLISDMNSIDTPLKFDKDLKELLLNVWHRIKKMTRIMHLI